MGLNGTGLTIGFCSRRRGRSEEEFPSSARAEPVAEGGLMVIVQDVGASALVSTRAGSKVCIGAAGRRTRARATNTQTITVTASIHPHQSMTGVQAEGAVLVWAIAGETTVLPGTAEARVTFD